MAIKFKTFSDSEKELEYRKRLSLSDLFAYYNWKKHQDLKDRTMKWFKCQCGKEASIFVEEDEIPNCSRCNKLMEVFEKKVIRTNQSDTVSVPRAYNKLGKPIKSAGIVRVSRKASEL